MGKLRELRELIVACQGCPRLVKYRGRVAHEKRRAYQDWTYWGRPVPGFGDPQARLVIVGLAPAAHGGNRTGRVFTGDPSASFLMRALHAAGFANQPTSESLDDGLRLKDAYITAAVRCAPPANRPRADEIHRCAPFLAGEIDLIRPRGILTLGRLAFDASVRYLIDRHLISKAGVDFRHAAHYDLGSDIPRLFAAYHPSPRNTRTGLMSEDSFQLVVDEVRDWLASS